ncbi:FAD-dependent monooxygenase [Streptomyces flavofungini]|uniref:FAD-dependent monooxygenase n=1 Tax=Streptomyces flavofungini TaxID=68200 RepID=UPI0025AF78A4|nr:FAD-dependent monooxygenase [Streptomyces flavofungini]WJV44812.1 FAD-dependent monooxygenase [Streptomyces flavofungini]
MDRSRGARTAVVVGAGMAGLAAATALARRGWRVEIAELGATGATSGWGLCLTGPALRALDDLGLADACLAEGYGMSVITQVDVDGEPAAEVPLPRLIGARRPAMVGIARPLLHRVLYAEAERCGVVVRHGLTVTAVEPVGARREGQEGARRGGQDEDRDGVRREGQDGELVRVRFSDGTVRQVALLVGADGIRSTVRGLLGFESRVDYQGQMVWRALVPRPSWATGIHHFAGKPHAAGVVPVSDSGAYVFLTEHGAARNVLPRDELAPRLRELLATFPARMREIGRSVSGADAVVRRPVLTAYLDGPWNRGNAVVVGDAAHAPAPQLAGGAALAIEDGLLLAEELERHASTAAGLAAFVTRRARRCRTLVDTSVAVVGLEREGHHHDTYPLIDACHRLMAEPA